MGRSGAASAAARCRRGTASTLRRGDLLEIGGAADAVWGYLAMAGGIDLPGQLGSLSTHVRSGIGGLGGRAIRAGDEVPLAIDRAPRGHEAALAPVGAEPGPIRVVLGPQDDFFTPEAIEAFLEEAFTVTFQFDRLGYRLTGPVLEHAKGFNIISDGVVAGCIQVPGDGQPIVLMRDCQSPGGYPKIATVITADLGRLAQHRPGTEVRFRQVAVTEAQLLRRRMVADLADLPDRLLPATTVAER